MATPTRKSFGGLRKNGVEWSDERRELMAVFLELRSLVSQQQELHEDLGAVGAVFGG